MARKVVGGQRRHARSSCCCRDATGDPLFLQVKEATASVLEDHLPKSRYQQPASGAWATV
jgi:hypothetical protein